MPNPGVMFRVSTEIDNALPDFAKAARDDEYLELFDLFLASWDSGDRIGVFTYADRFTQYALEETYIFDRKNLDRLTILARRLWLIATHDVFTKDNERVASIYEAEALAELDHIATLATLTLQNRIRALQILLTVLQSLRESLPTVWEVNSLNSHAALNERLSFIRMEVLVQLLEDYLLKVEVGTSHSRRKAWATSLVRIAAVMRHIWSFREDLGFWLVEHFLGKECNIDLRSNEIFFKFRMLLLMCPSSTLYRLLVNGDLCKWWFLVNEFAVNSWNSMMVSFLLRAVKFGWATGQPYLVKDITDRIPYFSQVLYSVLNIPNIVSVSKFRESIPGEFTVLLEKPLNIFKKFGKLFAYLVCPITAESPNEVSFTSEISDCLTSVVNAVYPYTHPSNGGKWSTNIASFVKHFVLGYTRRVCRERASESIVASVVGMVHNERNMRLTRENDVAVVEWLYSLALQGMYSKNMHVAYAYEDVIKRLCHLLPDTILVGFLDHLVLSTESVTEPHQMLGALRLFAQLIPLIVKYTPQALIPLLDISVKGIDPSDPFKTGQTLTLVNVIFSHLACRDLTDIQLSDEEKVELVRAIYLKGPHEMGMNVEDSMQKLALNSDAALDVKSAMFNLSRDMKMPNECDGIFSREMVILHTTNNVDEAVTALDALLGQRRLLTQNFPWWCQDWFGAMLQLAENSTKPNASTDSLMNAVDMGTYILTRSALVTVLSQTDTNTLSLICERFVSWVIGNVFRQEALKYMVVIATSLSFANGKLAMELVFDKLFAKFKQEHEASSEGLGEKQLVWFTACFAGLVRRAPTEILTRLSSISFILTIGLGHKSKNGFKYASKLLQRCVESLVGVYFTDSRCTDNFKDELNRGLLLWDIPWFARDGKFYNGRCDISVITGIKWHIAPKEELECAIKLCLYAIRLIVDLTNDIIGISSPAMPEGASTIDIDIDSSSPPYVRMNRAFILSRCLLRAMKDFMVDERDIHTKGLPRVTPVEFTEFWHVQKFVFDLIMATIARYGDIYATHDLAATKILSKMLKVVDEYLCRCASHGDNSTVLDSGSLVNTMRQESTMGTTITATKSMLHWMSFYYGVHNKAYWQDSPRAAWLMMLHERYYERLNRRKVDHECTGPRRDLLNFMLDCATCQYKDVSGYAQQLIKPVIYAHRRIKTDVIDYLLNRGINIFPQSANGCSSALECLACIPESMSFPLLKQIATKAHLFSKFCQLICGIVSTAPNRDSLMSKYDNLLLNFLACREYVVPTAETADTMNFLLDSLLNVESNNQRGVTHWRFQLYATVILVCFCHMIPPENVWRYVSWLMEASDHRSKQSSVATVALFGLYKLLADDAFSQQLPSELSDPKFAAILLNSIHAVNHDSIKEENSSTVKQSNAIVVSVLKLERTWPRNRSCSNSKAFSMQNFLVTYHYFSYLLRLGRMDSIECAKVVLEELASSSPTSFECHCAFAEISSALMKVSLFASPSDRNVIWQFLQPVLRLELENLVPDRIVDFMDGLRLSIDGADFSSESCVPIFNLGINFRAPLSLASLHKCDLGSADNSSLGVVKQLKLYQALLQQVTTQNTAILDILCDGILTECAIFNDSLQVVDEVGYLCSFLVSLCCAYEDNIAFKTRIHQFISQLIPKIDDNSQCDTANESKVKGLLSVIGLLYSASLPALDLGHQHTPRFLEFCLKFNGNTNPNISEISTKALYNIAMSPYYSRGTLATVESIIETLEGTAKLQSNKVKATSLQVASMMQRNLCMSLRKTEVIGKFVKLYISALQERHIWEVARDALAAITLTANDQLHLELTQQFYEMIKNGNGKLANAGVFGLAALVSTSPYHVPKWMPHTLTTLASCAAPRFPDVVRKTVQATLQDFFKSHMDAWSQVHVHKFTREQLDVLEMYKGCPAYFN